MKKGWNAVQTVFSLSPFVSTKQWESYYESCVIERCDNFTRREEEKWPVTPHTLQTSAVVVDVLIPKNLDGFFHVVLFSRPPGDGRARATVVAGQERWCTQHYIQEREIMDAWLSVRAVHFRSRSVDFLPIAQHNISTREARQPAVLLASRQISNTQPSPALPRTENRSIPVIGIQPPPTQFHSFDSSSSPFMGV